MEYRIFDPADHQASLNLPEELSKDSFNGTKTLTCFGGFEDDCLITYIILSETRVDKDSFWLEYMETIPDRQGRGEIKSLLKALARHYNRKGKRALLCKAMDSYAAVEESVRLMEGWGFYLLNAQGVMRTYDFKEMGADDEIAMIRPKRGTSPLFVSVSIEDRNDKRLTELLKSGEAQGFIFDRNNYDTELSKFGVSNGRINSAVIVEPSSKGHVYVSGIYLNKAADAKGVFVLLFVNMLISAMEKYGQDFTLDIELYNDSILSGMDAAFNPPREEKVIEEWIYLFDGKAGTR